MGAVAMHSEEAEAAIDTATTAARISEGDGAGDAGAAPALPSAARPLSGIEQAAALLLVLGRDHGGPIWDGLSADEVRDLSAAMASLGQLPVAKVEAVMVRFAGAVASMASLHGSYETTERLLAGMMPEDKVREIMEDIRGPSGRTMWDKLSNVPENILAAYLKNEYPQTVAVIVSRLRPDHAARVLAELPQPLAVDVVRRMLRMDSIQKSIIEEVERTLRTEFMNNLSRTHRRDPHEVMAEVFNGMDRASEEALLGALEKGEPESAERIRALMFTFDDVTALHANAIAVIVRKADKAVLALALKGADEPARAVFFAAMTDRAAAMLKDDIKHMGPTRLRDCEQAQADLVRLTKSLADAGEIMLSEPGDADEVLV